MAYTRVRRSALHSTFSLLVLLACKGSDPVKPLVDVDSSGGSGGVRTGSGGAGGSSNQPQDAGADAAPATNCGEVVCRGAGKCEVTAGVAHCVCDPGYVLRDGECVIDETCINLRLLENGCRQRQDAEPALAIFFGLETCAGTTVRSDLLGPLATAFKVLEDDHPLGDESYVELFPRDVEPFVTIALDLSGSLQREQNTLVAVIAQLKQMVQALTPAQGAPPINMSLIIFGRTVQVARDFTRDLSQIVAALDAIQSDPAGYVDPGGTNLFGAVNYGIAGLSASMESYSNQTGGGVVTTGTLVTITDGRDSSGVLLEAIPGRLNAISVGISSDIDDKELTRIGPQGSFLAPTQPDWSAAFDRVVQRVLEYPKRSYLLGYCSPAVAGTHKVTVTLSAREAHADVSCQLKATDFGVGLCNASFFDGYCAARSCGSFLACGGCEADAGAAQSQKDGWTFTLPE